jgi:GNAT superfamily N-acetyltransferase
MDRRVAADDTEHDAIRIRRATSSDAATIAHHRVGMFRDMGRLGSDAAHPLFEASRQWLVDALAREEYLGWLASMDTDPGVVVAGAGVQVRRVLPFPQRLDDGSVVVAEGRQAIVVNVFTEAGFRRRGLARRLMEAIIGWAADVRLDSLVLHAAVDGRPLYESLGFAPTNEMRYGRILTVPSGT